MNIEKARFNMIEQQIKPWKVFDQKLLGAMATVPREKFVPQTYRSLAYADTSIPLGHGQSTLAPRELARMIQALELTGNEKVLEIGTGTGYSAAVLARLCKKVYSVDIISEFVETAKSTLNQLSFSNVFVEEADAADCWLAKAPYHAVLITAALPELSDSYKRSLTKDGRIVSILGSAGRYHATLCTLDSKGEWQYERLFPVAAVNMINAEQPSQFVF